MQPYTHRLEHRARALRANQTDAEQCLWRYLRRKQMIGQRFYRQRPMLNYIADFYCPVAGLIIELDGGQHFEPENAARDQNRTARLEAEGLLVMRFSDREVLQQTTAVLEAIRKIVTKRLQEGNPPAPAAHPPSRLRRQRG